MAAAAVARYTSEDLLAMPDQGRFELIGGQLVERNMGAESSLVATNLLFLLGQFVRPRSAGSLFESDCGFQIFRPDTDRVRYADGRSFGRVGFRAASRPKVTVASRPTW